MYIIWLQSKDPTKADKAWMISLDLKVAKTETVKALNYNWHNILNVWSWLSVHGEAWMISLDLKVAKTESIKLQLT